MNAHALTSRGSLVRRPAGSRRPRMNVVLLVLLTLFAASCGPDKPSDPPRTSKAALDLTPNITDFTLYAERSILFGSNDTIHGLTGVKSVSLIPPGLLPSGATTQIYTESNDTFGWTGGPLFTVLIAPSVTLNQGSLANGDVQVNTLFAPNGAVAGQVIPFDPTVMPPLPLPIPTQCDPSVPVVPVNVTYPGPGETMPLAPGCYGDVTVADGATLWIGYSPLGTPNFYSFNNITMGNNSAIMPAVAELGIGATVLILVSGSIVTGISPVINYSPTVPGFLDGLPGSPLVANFYLLGTDPPDGPLVRFGTGAYLAMQLAAPRATVSLASNTTMMGALAGFDIQIGDNVAVSQGYGFVYQPYGEPILPNPMGYQQLSGYYGPPPATTYSPLSAGYATLPTVAPVVGPVPASTLIALDIGLPVTAPD